VRGLALSAAALAFLLAAPAAAQTQDLTITIYTDDVALGRDVREIAYEAGRAVVEFPEVSASIMPQTVALTASDVTVLEQNFDYDLLSPAKLMEKAVGQRVRIVRTNPGNGAETSEVAEVLSVNEGAVLRIGSRIEVLRDDGLPTRVIFDRVPPNLRARPTLSVDLQTNTPGKRPTELRYLTRGLLWKADYVGVFDEKAGRIDLQGWITLTNRSGTSYPNARAHLVAGNLNFQSGGAGGGRPRAQTQREAGTEASSQQTLADYYLYDLPHRTTIADRQTKQVGFVDASGAPARKVYRFLANGFPNMDTPASAIVSIDFSNARAAGMGVPLPAGVVRMYARDRQAKAQFIGEDAIEHTSAGSQLAIDIGEAFDVTAQSEITDGGVGNFWDDGFVEMKYTFRNARFDPARIVFEQHGLGFDWEIEEESLKGTKRDAFSYRWEVDVPAEGETVLSFRVDWD
jgi:hypothetical protein